ncbi:hypothetical protein KL86PLE_130534 [uncultured Pleomorphomonas sp.]|uniref:Uncharacterized protein n=1 Tax=uncultured Pleomorphomonas sp. TaxID=442121 RepID=A0A212LC41_9HYPH|nr:hypothetical protein [uncultured Pleomorphomonas sp.]SCM70002.1 hypothetical protein KL86PLE_10001 [uncultured Pleomorphomonas sp.]SCM75133.1 hypothetical protein KL86PLE_130534 [uncultured Pleomorphomonas sp.]
MSEMQNSTTSAVTVEALMAQTDLFAERIDMLNAGATAMFEGLVMAIRGAEDVAVHLRAQTTAGCLFQLKVVWRYGEDILNLMPDELPARNKAVETVQQIHAALDSVMARLEERPKAAA